MLFAQVRRSVLLLAALIVSLGLVLSGCGVTDQNAGATSGDENTSSQSDKKDTDKGLFKPKVPTSYYGEELLSGEDAWYGDYSYENEARPSSIGYSDVECTLSESEEGQCDMSYGVPDDEVGYMKFIDDGGRTEEWLGRQDDDLSKSRDALEEMGYRLTAITEMGRYDAELNLAYRSDLFKGVGDGYDEDWELYTYGVVVYTVMDANDDVYDAFVPSRHLIRDFGEQGKFTADFLFYYQESEDGGKGTLYHNLTPDDANQIFYGGGM